MVVSQKVVLGARVEHRQSGEPLLDMSDFHADSSARAIRLSCEPVAERFAYGVSQGLACSGSESPGESVGFGILDANRHFQPL